MATSLTLRNVKGSALTHIEMDANLTALRDTADAALPSSAATEITDTKPSPVDADQLIMLDSAASGAPVLVTKAQLLAGVGSGGLTSLALWDFWYLVRMATTGATAPDMFAGAAISSGTNTTAIPTGGQAGFNSYGVFLRSGTTANGGYRYLTTSLVSDYFGTISHKFRGQFLWRTSFTGRTVRMGYLDTNTSADAVDGAYFEIVGDVCSAKTASNSTRTTNATTLTLALDTAYTFDIDVNADGTEAQFRVYGGTSETALLDVTNTTNIPTTSARAFGAGIVATESSTTASDIGILYSLGIGTIEGFARAAGAVSAPAPSATVPATLTNLQWDAQPTAVAGEMEYQITALPSDGGSAITALEYRVGAGAAIALTGTGTGNRTVTSGWAAGTAADTQIRAVNAIGPGAWSDVKTRTPAAAGGSVTYVGAGTPFGTISSLTAHTVAVPAGMAVGDLLVVVTGDFAEATSVVTSTGQNLTSAVRRIGNIWWVVLTGSVPTSVTINLAVASDQAAVALAYRGPTQIAGVVDTESFEARSTIPYTTDAASAAVVTLYTRPHPNNATAAQFNGGDAADYLYKIDFTVAGLFAGIHDGPTGSNNVDMTWSATDTGGHYASVAFKA